MVFLRVRKLAVACRWKSGPGYETASRELWRHARINVLVVNPDAPGAPDDRSADTELIRG